MASVEMRAVVTLAKPPETRARSSNKKAWSAEFVGKFLWFGEPS
jgi:hypothetical protein